MSQALPVVYVGDLSRGFLKSTRKRGRAALSGCGVGDRIYSTVRIRSGTRNVIDQIEIGGILGILCRSDVNGVLIGKGQDLIFAVFGGAFRTGDGAGTCTVPDGPGTSGLYISACSVFVHDPSHPAKPDPGDIHVICVPVIRRIAECGSGCDFLGFQRAAPPGVERAVP